MKALQVSGNPRSAFKCQVCGRCGKSESVGKCLSSVPLYRKFHESLPLEELYGHGKEKKSSEYQLD